MAKLATPAASRSQWPALNVELWSLAKIKRYDKNPRTHPPEQIKVIKALMLEFGVTMPPLVDPKDQVLIAGHGRLEAAEQLVKEGHKQFEQLPVAQAIGWTAKQKRAYRVADNLSALMSGWNEELLKGEAIDLMKSGYALPLLGFQEQHLLDLGIGPDGPTNEMGDPDRHALLRLIDITIADPKHECHRGDHYKLDGRHHLLVISVITEWPRWSSLLVGADQNATLFCPYAGVFVPFSEKARDHVLVMVQPDPYIAGHVLDRYAEIYGEKRIVKQAATS